MLLRFLFVVFCYCISYSVSAQASCDCAIQQDASPNPALIQKLLQSKQAACQAQAWELIADTLIEHTDFKAAAEALQKAEKLYEAQKCPDKYKKSLFRRWVALSDHQAAFDESLRYQLQLLKLAEAEKNDAEAAGILLGIAQVFNRQKQSATGIRYARSAARLIEQMPVSAQKANLLNKLTARYFYFFQDNHDQAYADTAQQYVSKALTVAKAIGNTNEQIIALTRMGAIAESKQAFQQALGYIDQALALCRPGLNDNQYSTLYGDKGNIYLQLKNYTAAKQFADSCLFYCKKIAFPPMIANAHSLLYEIAMQSGNYKDALMAMSAEKQITDSLQDADRSRVINELERKYNQEKNEKTIQELALQKQIYILVLFVVVLFGVAVVLFLRQQSLRQQQKAAEAEQRLNRARINPHFFFNTLAGLQAKALEEGGVQTAGKIAKLSRIMRTTLENTYREFNTIEEEIGFLENYLQLHLPDNAEYKITVDTSIEATEVMIPSMLIQPFIENSIVHGLTGIDYGGVLAIQFSLDQQSLLIRISDNGRGFSDTNASTHISRGGQIIADRLYLLAKQYRAKATYSITSGSEQSGVTALIRLPLITKA
jgi:tetratricopeptide (TPR) repeat protein